MLFLLFFAFKWGKILDSVFHVCVSNKMPNWGFMLKLSNKGHQLWVKNKGEKPQPRGQLFYSFKRLKARACFINHNNSDIATMCYVYQQKEGNFCL